MEKARDVTYGDVLKGIDKGVLYKSLVPTRNKSKVFWKIRPRRES